MDRIPILDMKEVEPLAENLSLVIRFDPQALPCIYPPAQAVLKFTQHAFDHWSSRSAIVTLISPRGKAERLLGLRRYSLNYTGCAGIGGIEFASVTEPRRKLSDGAPLGTSVLERSWSNNELATEYPLGPTFSTL